MSKYNPLTAYLRGLNGKPWRASLTDVENVLGFKLPASARNWYAWWANRPQAHANAWIGAGFRVVNVDLDAHEVTFTPATAAQAEDESLDTTSPITEAKMYLSQTFSITPEQIEIVIRG